MFISQTTGSEGTVSKTMSSLLIPLEIQEVLKTTLRYDNALEGFTELKVMIYHKEGIQ